MSKVKVLILGKLPPPYIGPAVATEIILNSRLKNEFELIHLDTSDHRDINTLGALDFCNFYLAFKHYFCLLWLIITRWPSLIYMPIGQTTISYFRDAIFILIAKLFQRKVVSHLRGSNFRKWYASSSALTKWFVRCIHPLVDGQIVLGNKLRNLFNWIISEEKIYVIPNGLNINFQSDSKVKQVGEKIKILFLSSFHRSKGVIDVLKSALYVCKKYSNIEFIFVGSWRESETKREFENILKEHPQLPVIIKRSIYGVEKFKFFSSSDIFVLPSYNDGHPWAIIEAMAFSLSVISTDQGAITESVIDGYNGFIIEKKNPIQIAEKINELIKNTELREKMAKASFQHYLENFTENKMATRFIHCFNSVLQQD